MDKTQIVPHSAPKVSTGLLIESLREGELHRQMRNAKLVSSLDSSQVAARMKEADDIGGHKPPANEMAEWKKKIIVSEKQAEMATQLIS
jgi:hypothetical protein